MEPATTNRINSFYEKETNWGILYTERIFILLRCHFNPA